MKPMSDINKAELARVTIAAIITDDMGLYTQEDAQEALAVVPDNFILATNPNGDDDMMFWRTFVDAWLVHVKLATGKLPSESADAFTGLYIERVFN